MITTQDILDLLPIVADRGWRLNEELQIRDRKRRCPICALVNEIDCEIDYYELAFHALESIRVSKRDREQFEPILFAADHLSHSLRPQLMQALGMR